MNNDNITGITYGEFVTMPRADTSWIISSCDIHTHTLSERLDALIIPREHSDIIAENKELKDKLNKIISLATKDVSFAEGWPETVKSIDIIKIITD